ncbi:DUF3592 domain-containing protein [Cocleimonas sp. KMM 6892]|uniref:DUF3592 domain-containing protein n=1 Tax=unclassified Cocleimonas TaxID=2639732 RepID=UPI002DB5E9A1|nr:MULTISPECIES: DUF3592 domain-containing protein [unclassified Cocleimonas]MEB8434486.1 DUF3592 domain-containing protein [Cocleimonas sp. KMM 6892]MEC4717379.1 DUF3592 domain-containing protein [Cocleimonas sp. KMM 6895]MEC4746758.1 DUF3592 domain-containing protein [Cocleimonas sp. KMM 6896]
MSFALLIGLFLLILCVKLTIDEIKFSKNKVETVGRIISIRKESHMNSDGHVPSELFIPKIEFDDLFDNKVVFENEGSYKNNLKQGQTIAIEYEKSNPQNAVIKTWNRWFMVLILLLFATTCIYNGL